MENPVCVHCGKPTERGELLCGECCQLRSGERGFSSATTALVCLVQQAEGHQAVRIFEKPVEGAGALVIGEVPSGTLVRCSDRDVRLPFFKVQWQELNGWVGVKNVSWVQTQISQSEGDTASIAETPGEPPPAKTSASSRKAGVCDSSWSWARLFCGSAAAVERESSSYTAGHDTSGTPSAKVRAAEAKQDFNLQVVNSKPVVPFSAVDPRDEALIRLAERMITHCTFLELTVLSPAELRRFWDDGRANKEGTLELYSPFASVPATVKQAALAEIRKLAGSPASRAVGALVGMAVADATGAPFEFMPARNAPSRVCVMIDPTTLDIAGKPFNKFHLKAGQWSDDTAMGLCLADSLLENQGYNGSDVRVKFHNWWFRGYNNAFGNDHRMGSVGLGGNVSKSLAAMVAGRIPPPRYEAPNEDAGNGSLMRLAAVPVFYQHSPDQAAARSAESSRSTHPGPIAAAACAFLGFAIAKAITRDNTPMTAKEFLDGVVGEFLNAEMPGAGECEELRRLLQSNEPRGGREECWNWRDSVLQIESSLYARGRSYNGYPCTAGYFGSYCIDGLAIALWGFYSTSTFHEAVVRCVNCLGDADTTAAICGQLAGAFYGYEAVPERWLRRLEKWDDQDIACRGVLLHLAAQADVACAADDAD